MRKKQADRVEILAPAGSMASMRAALAAGADAVYMGGPRFGARAYADNPGEAEFLEAIDYVHLHGRRLYLTLNTLLKEHERERELYDYVRPLYEQGLDGVIVQDLGVLCFLREHFPGLPLHGSTQMTITGICGVRAAGKLGISRVVPARELSLSEIRRIYEATGAELEVFIHGALCYSYSGQCLLSSFIGGRSGNRGRCAGPCRLPYEVSDLSGRRLTRPGEDYVLSLKDLCGLSLLPDVLEAGVYSLKIEGRMKSPAYTAGVTSVYRAYADRYLEDGREHYRVEEKDLRFLRELYDRGGFTDGYLTAKVGRDMVARKEKPEFREVNPEVIASVEERFVKPVQKERVLGEVRVRKGEPLSLTARCEDVIGQARAGMAKTAEKRPLTEEELRKQIGRTGNTPFEWEDLAVEMDPDVFVPVKVLNELRRSALEDLTRNLTDPYRRGGLQDKTLSADGGQGPRAERLSGEYRGIGPEVLRGRPEKNGRREWQVYMEDLCYLPLVLEREAVDAVLLDEACLKPGDWKNAADRCREKGKKCYLGMPYVFRIQSCVKWKENRKLLSEAGFDGFLVRNLDEAEFLHEIGIEGERMGEASLYTMNRGARNAWQDLGIDRFVLPYELNRAELRRRALPGDGLLVYGYLPVMISSACVQRTTAGCSGKSGWLVLKDRKRERFFVRNRCSDCTNVIYNSKPVSLYGCGKEAEEIEVSFYRIHLTREPLKRAEEILDAFLGGFSGEAARAEGGEDFTRGHFHRGVW